MLHANTVLKGLEQNTLVSPNASQNQSFITATAQLYVQVERHNNLARILTP